MAACKGRIPLIKGCLSSSKRSITETGLWHRSSILHFFLSQQRQCLSWRDHSLFRFQAQVRRSMHIPISDSLQPRIYSTEGEMMMSTAFSRTNLLTPSTKATPKGRVWKCCDRHHRRRREPVHSLPCVLGDVPSADERLDQACSHFKLLQVEDRNGTSWPAVVVPLLDPLIPTVDEQVQEIQQVQLFSLIELAFAERTETIAISCTDKHIEEKRNEFLFFQGPLRVSFSGYRFDRSRLWKRDNAEKRPPKIFPDKLVELAFATKEKETVCLYGESSYKTELIRTWPEISQRGNKAQMIHLTSDSEATELIGQTCLVWMVEVLEMLLSIGNFILKEIEEVLAVNNMPKKREYSIRRLDCSDDLPRRGNATHSSHPLEENQRWRATGNLSQQWKRRSLHLLKVKPAFVIRPIQRVRNHMTIRVATQSGEHLRVKKKALIGKKKSTAAADCSEQYPGAKTDFGIRIASEPIEEPEYSTFEFVRETVRG